MADELTTKPTIETVLERIIAFENRLTSRFDQFEKEVAARFDKAQERFDSIDNEIDRVASVAHSTKAEMLTLRADFRELRVQVREARSDNRKGLAEAQMVADRTEGKAPQKLDISGEITVNHVEQMILLHTQIHALAEREQMSVVELFALPSGEFAEKVRAGELASP